VSEKEDREIRLEKSNDINERTTKDRQTDRKKTER